LCQPGDLPKRLPGIRSYPPKAIYPDLMNRSTQTSRKCSRGPGPSELLHVLMLPDFDRVDRIGEF
jgi:hypothetical protein